ncbi:MAG: CHAT domain-containing tetratricopeptide repeat protein, partial [Bacteroidota bacterium]
CRKALSIHQSSLGEDHPQVWQYHAELARVLARKEAYDTSLLHFARALEVRNTTSGEFPWLDNARIRLGTADVYRRMGLLDEALTASKRAVNIQKGHPDRNPLLWAEAHRSVGDIYRTRSQFDIALLYYQQALIALAPGFSDTALHAHPRADSITYGRETVGLLMAKAAVLQEWDDAGENNLLFLDAALDHYQTAAHLLKSLQRTYRDDRSKLMLADAHHTLYGAAVELCADLFSRTGSERYKELGFSFAEQGKAGILLDHITRAGSKESAGIPDSLLRLERDITRELRFCETKILKLGETDGAGGHNMSHLRSRVVSLHQKRDDLDDMFASRYPSYNAWQGRAPVASVAELMGNIDPASSMVEYVAGSDRLYCFIITRDSLHCITLAGKEECEESATAYRRALKTMNKRLYLSAAPELYDMLVKPIEAHLAPGNHLIIVPDGFLHYLPFEALLREDASGYTGPNGRTDFTRLPYLVRFHDISYAFSANFAVAASRRVTDLAREAPSFAGFAPVFSDDKGTNRLSEENALFEGPLASSLRSITVDGKTFTELPNSEGEVNTIIAGFRKMGYEGEGYFHSAATEENFKVNAGKHPYIHIATHGFINDQSPELSALIFTGAGPSRREEDGVLYASEIMNLQLDASLLVLSSCQSGVGRVVRGEGILAMTRAFALAGAQNIVCSLWKVYDSHASLLMQNFYRAVLARKPYTGALREAKLQMIKDPVTAFPMKWAGFVLIGTPLHPSSPPRMTRAGSLR